MRRVSILSLILVGLAVNSHCYADLMITGFNATDEDTSVTWQGFGFQVTSTPADAVAGFGLIDLGDSGIVAAEARLWSANGPGFTLLADATFAAGEVEELATSPSFTYSGTTIGLGVNGFRLTEFDNTYAGFNGIFNTGTTYIIAARALVADPFNPAPGEGIDYFQGLTGAGFPTLDITLSSPYEIVSSLAAATALNGATGNDLSANYFGLQGFQQAPNDVNIPPFNSLAPSGGLSFNPISVNLFTGTLEENLPEDPPTPGVPEPSSMVLAGLGVAILAYRRRRAS